MILIEKLFQRFTPNISGNKYAPAPRWFSLVKCDNCGVERAIKLYANRNRLLCSACSGKTELKKKKISDAIKGQRHYLYGKHHTEEQKRKISLSLTGEKNGFYGKKHDVKTRQKISSTMKSLNLKGENSPLWNKNLTQADRISGRLMWQMIECRKSVFKRDNYTCQVTKQKGGDLISHHLNSWHWCKERRFDISNCITITKEIHNLFHTIYGNKNNTESQFNEFKSYMNEVLLC